MRASRLLLVVLVTLTVPALVSAQETPRDTLRSPSPAGELGVRFRLLRDSVLLEIPALRFPFSRFRRSLPLPGAELAVRPSPVRPPGDTLRQPADTARRDRDILGEVADLGVQFQSRIELKTERTKDERCIGAETLRELGGCSASFQPQFDFQFGVRSGGVVANRVHVDVDYDSQREFDASNNISIYYEGKPDELLQRVEVGNVTFTPPPSRFITGGIPSGNYGFQAVGKVGSMSFRTIYAQQKGNVVQDRIFTVGDRTLQTVEREIEDFQIERRRFFWVLDPRAAFPGRFPNIDILDRSLATLAQQIPPGQRPRR
ncbi:MAG: hypothetical protein ACREON_02575, partial [Gemmatimonadaceae bacterium]